MINGESEKHNKIMSAAADLFAKQGYKKTTIDEIVTKAEISKGLFYHYFPNKKKIYTHLYNVYADVLKEKIRDKVDISETDFLRRLKQIVYIRIDFISEYPNLWNFLYSAYFEEHPDVAPSINEKNKWLLQSSFEGSAANIDWSKLKHGLSPEKAIEIVTWIAEGFVRKIEKNPASNTKLYYQFDEYIECLKSGLYGGE